MFVWRNVAVCEIVWALNWSVKVDLYEAFSGHSVPLCVCQVSDCVCNVKDSEPDLDFMQEIKPNYMTKIGAI